MKKKIFFIFLPAVILLLASGCTLFPSAQELTTSSRGGKGVWRSNDKGESWQEKNDIKESQQKINGVNVTKLVFDVLDSRLLYAVTDKGIYFSEDGAGSWRLLYKQGGINDMVINPKTRGIIYVAVGNQIFKTTDNGANWELVYTEARANTSVVGVAISSFDTSRIYALTSEGSLTVSNDWGESWKLLYDFKSKTKRIFIDPDNSQTFLVAADNGLYRTLNGGESWTEIIKEQNKNFPGSDQFRDLYFLKNQEMIVYLCRYGILTSKDKGTSWQAVKTVSTPGTVEIRAVAYNPKDSDELYYVVDNVLYHTLDAGRNWRVKTLPHNSKYKVTQLLVDFYDSDNLYLGLGQ